MAGHSPISDRQPMTLSESVAPRVATGCNATIHVGYNRPIHKNHAYS